MEGQIDKVTRKSDHIETSLNNEHFKDWPEDILQEMRLNHNNGCVGSVLVSETKNLRIWHLTLAPGARCPFHRHVNPYFWTSHSSGRCLNYLSNGEIKDVAFYSGETRHYYYAEDEYMLHSLENIGETELIFTTVEFIDGKNSPLPIPENARLTEYF